MARVEHVYIRDPKLIEERAAAVKRREAAAKRREAANRRREAAKEATSRAAWQGVAGLRRERTEFERIRRLEKEMEVAARRGLLIEKAVVEKQAAIVFTNLRAAILNFAPRYARQVVGLEDLHQAREVLDRAAREFLTELSGFAERMTANADLTDDGDGAPDQL